MISHLFFVVYSLFFFKNTLEEAHALKNIFCLYKMALGQQINYNKSSIVFSPHVQNDVKVVIAGVLGVSVVERHGMYLSLPSIISRSKKSTYEFLVEKAHKKVQGWRNKKLSQGGKEVLLKL